MYYLSRERELTYLQLILAYLLVNLFDGATGDGLKILVCIRAGKS